MQRHLDDRELSVKHLSPTIAVAYHGHLDTGALAQAVKVLCTRHPVLRAHIRVDDGGHLLSVEGDEYLELTVIDGDQEALWHEATGPWDNARGVAQLLLIRGEKDGFVGLRVSHAVLDGGGIFALLAELFNLYTDIVDRSDTSVDPNASLTYAPLDLLRQRWQGFEAPTSAEPPTNSTSSAGDEHITDTNIPCEGLSRRAILSREDTNRLIAVARKCETTVGALLTGAIVLAVDRIKPQARQHATKVLFGIDLRRHVAPPVTVTETANLYGMNVAQVTLTGNSNPVTIGGEISDQQKTAIKQRELIVPGISSPDSLRKLWHPSEMYHMINNMGTIPRFERPPGLELSELMILPTTNRTFANVYDTRFYTFEGRLNAIFIYPSSRFTDTEVQDVVEHFLDELAGIMDVQPTVEVMPWIRNRFFR